MRQSVFYYVLLINLFVISISGVTGGLLLIIKTDGSLLGLKSNWLDNSPFENYLLPGILLFLTNGLLPLFTLIGNLFRPEWKWANVINLYKHMHWSWAFSIYSGIVCIIWIIVQQIMTSYFWLQPVILSIGLFIILLSLIPSVMKKYENAAKYD